MELRRLLSFGLESPASALERRLLAESTHESPDALAVVDCERRVVIWSAGARRLLGWSASELGEGIAGIFAEPEEFDGLWSALGSSGLVERYAALLRRKDLSLLKADVRGGRLAEGEKTLGFRLGFSPFHPESGLAAETPEGRRELVLLERFATVGRMTASFCHDSRTPLAVIASTAEAALSSGASPREGLELVLRKARELGASIEALLEFARVGALRLRPGTLRPVVESALALVEKRCARQQVRVRARWGKSVESLIDAHHLQGVFFNIVNNALDAMPDGGSLTMASGVSAGWPYASIRDSGAGMPAELRSHLGPFFTTKAKGTGLGLYAAQLIVAEHGGKLACRSQEGKGTEFIVSLPPARRRRTVAKKRA